MPGKAPKRKPARWQLPLTKERRPNAEEIESIRKRARALTERARKRFKTAKVDVKPVFENELPSNTTIALLCPHADDLSLDMGRTAYGLTRPERKNSVHSFTLTSGHLGSRDYIKEKGLDSPTKVSRTASKGFTRVDAITRKTAAYAEEGRSLKRLIALRRLEATRESKVLGTKNHFLDFEFYDKKMGKPNARNAIIQRDIEMLLRQMLQLKPQIMFFTHELDRTHPDHHITHVLGKIVAEELVRITGQPIEIWETNNTSNTLAPKDITHVVINSPEARTAQQQALYKHASQLLRTRYDEIVDGTMKRYQNIFAKVTKGRGTMTGEVPPMDVFIRYRLVWNGSKVVREKIA
ncbi:MAG: PIG-L family deacetylase [archaeon]|nr:PIG-L family deacetylase [archaeon]